MLAEIRCIMHHEGSDRESHVIRLGWIRYALPVYPRAVDGTHVGSTRVPCWSYIYSVRVNLLAG